MTVLVGFTKSIIWLWISSNWNYSNQCSLNLKFNLMNFIQNVNQKLFENKPLKCYIIIYACFDCALNIFIFIHANFGCACWRCSRSTCGCSTALFLGLQIIFTTDSTGYTLQCQCYIILADHSAPKYAVVSASVY